MSETDMEERVLRYKEVQTWEDGNTVCLIGILNEEPFKRCFLNNKGSEIVKTTVSIRVKGRDCFDGPRCTIVGIEANFRCGEALGAFKRGQHIKLKGELAQEVYEEDGIKKERLFILVLELEELEIIEELIEKEISLSPAA